MKQSDSYNSPKGLANNAAQKQAAAKLSTITKKAVAPVTAPAMPIAKKSIAKGKKS